MTRAWAIVAAGLLLSCGFGAVLADDFSTSHKFNGSLTLLSMNAYDNDRIFSLEVTRSTQDTGDHQIVITCRTGCAARNTYSEHDSSTGLEGALSLGDAFVTIWGVGDGMLVRVYHLTATSITKVLEENSRGQWPVITSAAGRPAIILGDKTAGEILNGDKDRSYRVRGKLWVWNGSKYASR